MSKTPVIFRKWKGKDGDVIALFPEDPSDYIGYNCNSYEHVGQHGSADPVIVVSRTIPAKPEEYAELKEEMEKLMGYDDLVVIKRFRYSHMKKRQATIATMR